MFDRSHLPRLVLDARVGISDIDRAPEECDKKSGGQACLMKPKIFFGRGVIPSRHGFSRNDALRMSANKPAPTLCRLAIMIVLLIAIEGERPRGGLGVLFET